MNQMAEGLQRVEHLRRQLVANVAHELRTPLTNLHGYLEGIRDGVFEADPATLERLQRQTERLLRLVDDLSQLAEVERLGAVPSAMGVVDLGGVLEDAVESLRSRFAAKGVALELSLVVGLPAVRGDQHRLGQVVSNLLENALRYTESGGRVEVRGEARGREVVVSVSDTGTVSPLRTCRTSSSASSGETTREAGTPAGQASGSPSWSRSSKPTVGKSASRASPGGGLASRSFSGGSRPTARSAVWERG